MKNDSILRETEELLHSAYNRYHIVLQIVQRAKRKKYEELNLVTTVEIKPIVRAITEMANEIYKISEFKK